MAVGTGIDIGSRTVRVAKLVRKGKSIQWAGSVSAPADAGDLADQLHQAGISPRGGVVGLAGKDTLIRYARVPFVPAWKLKMLVGYEATQGGELDVAYDYRLLNLPAKADSNELMVMTAVAKNDALAQRLSTLAQRGIRGIDFAPDALALYEVFSHCPETDEALDKFCLVLDVGASKTEMIIVYNGGLIFARSVTFGGRDFTNALAKALSVDPDRAERLKVKHGEVLEDADIAARPAAERPMLTTLVDAAEEFLRAIRASLMFAKAQTKLIGLDIGRIYLSGAGAALPGLPEFLSAKLGCRATAFDPPDDWNVPHDRGRPGEWMIALGLALMSLQPPEGRVSLLPARVRKRRQFWRRNILAYAACAFFAAAAALGVAAYVHNWSVARTALAARKGLLESARGRDEVLATLIEGTEMREEQLDFLGSASGSGAALAEFLTLSKKSQQGPITLSRLTWSPGDLNKADPRAFVTLAGVVGQSTKTPHDILKEYWQRLDPTNPQPIEQLRKSADGSSLEFRLRVPIRIQPRVEKSP